MIFALVLRFTRVVVLVIAFASALTHPAHAQIDGDACGDGDAAIIFLHDQFQDAGSFSGIWPTICEAQNIRAIRYDRRGYGQSTATAEPYSDTSDLASIIQSLGITQATLVTSGTGAGIALEFALLYPDKVNGLVLSSPSLAGSTLSQDPKAINAVTVPALVLIGASDTPENIANAQAVSSTLPESNTVIMLSAAYYIEIARPGAFFDYVMGFVTGLVP